MEGCAMTTVVKAEPGLLQLRAGDSCDGSSRASSTGAFAAAAAAAAAVADTAEQPLHKAHHLLRHCLNPNQRHAALQHFSSQDAKEAAKEISRMGQRELQGKFKLVYGNATHSNNNNWLRRKLFEAIGAAPLKANSKGSKSKARPSSGGSSKPKKAASVDPPSRGSPTIGYGAHSQPLMVPCSAVAANKAFGAGHALPTAFVGVPAKQQHRAGAPRRATAGLPASPLLRGSVLDMPRYQSVLSREASDDDEEWCSDDEACNNAGCSPYGAQRRQAAQQQRAEAAARRQQQAQQQLPAALQHCSSMACAPAASQQAQLGLQLMDLALPVGGSDWLQEESWGDACGLLGGCGSMPPLGPAASPCSSLDDDDVLLLPMDLSALDTFSLA